jgi:hypothetical protein
MSLISSRVTSTSILYFAFFFSHLNLVYYNSIRLGKFRIGVVKTINTELGSEANGIEFIGSKFYLRIFIVTIYDTTTLLLGPQLKW